MALFRIKQPTGKTSAKQKKSYQEFLDAGYTADTIFFRAGNAPHAPERTYIVNDPSLFEGENIAEKDANDFKAIKGNVVGDFVPGLGPGATITELFRGSTITAGGKNFTIDQQGNATPAAQGVTTIDPGLSDVENIILKAVNEQTVEPFKPQAQEGLGGGGFTIATTQQEAPEVSSPTTTPTEGTEVPTDSPSYTYVNASGKIIRVVKGSPIEATYPQATYEQWIAQNFPQGKAEGTPSLGGVPTQFGGAVNLQDVSPNEAVSSLRESLQTSGIDTSMLSDDQVKVLGMMKNVIDTNAEKNKNLLPKDFTAEEMGKFLEDARAEISPYFEEQFDIAKQDLSFATQMLREGFQAQESSLQARFTGERERLDRSQEEAGTLFSGVRREAERRLAQEQRGLVESGRRQARAQTFQLGSELERQFGTDDLKEAGIPTVKSMAFPELELPSTDISFQPLGGLRGEARKTEETSAQLRADELQARERAKRLGLFSGQFPNV